MGTAEVSKPVAWDEVYRRLADAPVGRLYGVPRGGAIVAGLTGRAVDSVDEADCLVDDVADSGDTLRVMSDLTGKPTWTLFDRERDGLSDRDLVFPWDDPTRTQEARLLRLGRDLLDTLGYDVSSPALRETPRRWAAWWTEFLNQDAGRTNVTFDVVTEGQLVVVAGMHVWSVCEHHLLPFEVTVSVGYVPVGRVLGLSKFARLAQRAAHKLQIQERLIEEISIQAQQLVQTEDAAVLGIGRHLCMEARGPKTRATTTSFATSGTFARRAALRRDFLQLCALGVGGRPGIE